MYTTNINIKPQYQPNANTPRHIPKIIDLKFSSNHTHTIYYLVQLPRSHQTYDPYIIPSH